MKLIRPAVPLGVYFMLHQSCLPAFKSRSAETVLVNSVDNSSILAGTVAIAAIVALMAGSHIFTNQAFAISTIAKIIDSAVVGPCTQENGHFLHDAANIAHFI